MTVRALTRRAFLAAGASLAAATMIGRRAVAAGPSGPGVKPAPVQIFRLSARGRRGSKAAKLHNANMRFATAAAAHAHRAHPGDVSKVVALMVSADEFDRLFGARNREVADLRKLGGPAAVGDCNRNGVVAIDEIVRGVNIALGNAPVSQCKPFDRLDDGNVTVDELVRGVRNALG